jgi:hypothetical protein
MIDFLAHMLGICPDSTQHVNLLMIINEFLNSNYCWCYIKLKIKSIIGYGKVSNTSRD